MVTSSKELVKDKIIHKFCLYFFDIYIITSVTLEFIVQIKKW